MFSTFTNWQLRRIAPRKKRKPLKHLLSKLAFFVVSIFFINHLHFFLAIYNRNNYAQLKEPLKNFFKDNVGVPSKKKVLDKLHYLKHLKLESK